MMSPIKATSINLQLILNKKIVRCIKFIISLQDIKKIKKLNYEKIRIIICSLYDD